MSKENGKTLGIVIGEPVLLPSSKWVVAMSLKGNCLNDIESVEVSDDKLIKEHSSNRNMRFYVDFETDNLDEHRLNYRIILLSQHQIDKTIELKQKQQLITVELEETVTEKKVHGAIQASKATRDLEDLTGEITKENESPPQTISPFAFLQEAIRAVPAVKYALGIGGLIAVIAIVRGFGIDLRIASFGAIIMIILMTLLVIFARASTLAIRSLQTIVLIFTWFILILFMLISSILFSCVFFRWPVDLQHWIGK